jgi:hypothetical protein
MESIHVLEPTFHISAAPLRLDRSGWNGVPSAACVPGRTDNRVNNIVGGLAFKLLDRLSILCAPRIISAECLLADTTITAGNRR